MNSFLILFVLQSVILSVNGFHHQSALVGINRAVTSSSVRSNGLQMNFFNSLFGKKKSANAAHILVDGKDAKPFLLQLKMDLNKKGSPKEVKKAFNDAARQFSKCPSSKNGGELGTFKQGQMVPAFDKVVFSEALDTVHGPVTTPFGYHLIYINEREEDKA